MSKRATRLSDVRGFEVVARAEGARLGSVSHVYFNPGSRQISALAFKDGLGSAERFVNKKAIDLIGREVVLISTEKAATPMKELPKKELRSLKDLQGTLVTTLEGKNLGPLVDLNVDAKAWRLQEIRFADGKVLPVADPKEVTFGPDQILVPAEYESKVTRPKKDQEDGVIERLFGSEGFEEVRKSLRRAFRTQNGKTKDGKPAKASAKGKAASPTQKPRNPRKGSKAGGAARSGS